MKSPDQAIQTLTAAIAIGGVTSIGGVLAAEPVAVLVGIVAIFTGIGIAYEQWQPVRKGEEKATRYRFAWETEKRWDQIRKGRKPDPLEQWVVDATFDEYTNAVVSLWIEAGFPKTAKERYYYLTAGSGFIVKKAEGEHSEDTDHVIYTGNVVDL
jgi:hypothetical protein